MRIDNAVYRTSTKKICNFQIVYKNNQDHDLNL